MNSIHQPHSSPDFQFVAHSRGLYVKLRLLNNERKGVNHEIREHN